MRWLIRLEPIRSPRFGETRRDVSEWVVRAYVVRAGNRVFVGKRVSFPNLRLAHRWASAASIVDESTRGIVRQLSGSARRRPINITITPR